MCAPQVEGEATGRAIKLAKLVGVPLYVVHVMSEDALEEVRIWLCYICCTLLVHIAHMHINSNS